MKKYISIILIFILVSCYSITILALSKPVTRESLTDAFNQYAKGYSGQYTTEDGGMGSVSFGESTPIEVTEKQLVIKESPRTTYNVDYSLGESPKFSIKLDLNEETDLSNISDIRNILSSPFKGLLGVILSQGVPIGDAHNYYENVVRDVRVLKYSNSCGLSRMNNKITISLDEETKTYEKGNINYDELVSFLLEENKVIKDEKNNIYTYTSGYKKNSENNYTIEANLEINKDANFSKIAKITDSNNNTDNNNNNNNNSQKTSIVNKNNVNPNNTNKNNTNNAVNSNTNTTNEQNFPDTGTEQIVPIAIIVIYLIAIAFAIRIITLKDIK